MQKRFFLPVLLALVGIIAVLSWKLYSVSQKKDSANRPLNLPAEKQAYFTFSLIDTIDSKELHETRRINVYLPPGYSPDSAKRYPVIYLLDGGVEEDFIHISGLVRYYTQPWIDRFPGSIVVGIENTNRKRDFTFSVKDTAFLSSLGYSSADFPAYGGSSSFIAFIEKELQPFVEKKYRTSKGKTIIGESLGGLLATEILLRHRNLFDTYIIITPSLWWNNGSLLAEGPELLKTGTQEVKVYIGACNREEDQPMYTYALDLCRILKNAGNTKVCFDYLPEETHATISHQAACNAFRLLYPKTATGHQ